MNITPELLFSLQKAVKFSFLSLCLAIERIEACNAVPFAYKRAMKSGKAMGKAFVQ